MRLKIGGNGRRLGRRILRPLLRTELGEVSNRRAWAQPERLTPDIVALYSAPLRVQGWDAALLEACPPTQFIVITFLGGARTTARLRHVNFECSSLQNAY